MGAQRLAIKDSETSATAVDQQCGLAVKQDVIEFWSVFFGSNDP
jgi:hypothetical protein